MRKKISNKSGFSLIEVMVAMTIAAIVIGLVVAAMISQQKNHITQERLVDMQQGLRAAMEVVGSELKMVAYDPTATAGASILMADTAELQFQIDQNADGDLLDSGETIRFALTNDANRDGIADGTPCDLGRALDGGILQTLAENIDALNFVYFDSDGNVLPTPVANLPAIGSIQITLIARSGATLPGFFKSGQDNKTYHNRQGDVVLPAQNDGFHRMEIVHEFKGRNLLLN